MVLQAFVSMQAHFCLSFLNVLLPAAMVLDILCDV